MIPTLCGGLTTWKYSFGLSTSIIRVLPSIPPADALPALGNKALANISLILKNLDLILVGNNTFLSNGNGCDLDIPSITNCVSSSSSSGIRDPCINSS